jgi:ribose 5-phosphate isomerase B
MIGIGSDHGGFVLKEEVKNHYIDLVFKDFGSNTEDMVDFPPIAINLAESVAKGECESGILICRTGIGMSIAANKVKGIRAALCSDTFSAHACREHNNANILAMGERVVGVGVALDIVDTFLNAKFEGDRHLRRVNKIADIEKKYSVED